MADENAFQKIVDDFEILGDWDERYRYLIELGRDMPAFSEADHNPGNKVDGCVSQVWLVPRMETDADGARRFYFEGDSDAHITRGLIAILWALYSGQKLSDIAAIDAFAAFSKLDLEANISRQRSNGLQAMVKRIRQWADDHGSGVGA